MSALWPHGIFRHESAFGPSWTVDARWVLMPRFVILLASPVRRGAVDDSLRFVFPEVAFEQHLEGSDGSVRLMCRAPSESQLRRWGLAAGLDVSSILLHAEVTGSEQQ